MGLKYLRKKNFIPILSLNTILSCLVYKKKNMKFFVLNFNKLHVVYILG